MSFTFLVGLFSSVITYESLVVHVITSVSFPLSFSTVGSGSTSTVSRNPISYEIDK
jgi:hypothetical protein